MKVLKPQKLGILTRCYQHTGTHYFGTAILALHNFSDALFSEADMWNFLAEELGEVSCDAGIPKSAAEFLVSGHAFQPEGELGPTCSVRVQLGNIEKNLYVFGNRYWRSDIDWSEPEPFVQMPLTWEMAYGGSGFANCPVGKGFAPIQTKDGALHPLPNIETPNQLITSKQSRSEPAGLGPLDFMWPQRQAKVGTHDDRWLKESFPGFADDIDFSIFNMASVDQQQAEAFIGTEPFLIDGMHPTKPHIDGQLPGLATRCFVTQRSLNGDTFNEIKMRLTTVWFFPHAERFLTVFHGACEVEEDDADDVVDLLIAAEMLNEQKTVDHYKHVREQRLDPEEGSIHSLLDSDLLPSNTAITELAEEATAEMDDLFSEEGLLQKHQRNFAESKIAESRAYVVSLGLDPDLYAASPLPPDEPLPSLEELSQLQQRLDAEMEQSKIDTEQRQAEQEASIRELLISEGLDADEILAASKQPNIGPPSYSAEEELSKIRALSSELTAMGCPIEELDHYATDPSQVQMLMDNEVNAREGYRQLAHMQDAATRFEGNQAALSKAAVLETLKVQGNLTSQNLTGFDLSDMDFEGIDLSGAWLENANLQRTNLRGAILYEAVLARADLTETILEDADLRKANLGLAELVRTKADRANLSESILNNARLQGASFKNALFDSADLTDATISTADMSGASFANLFFHKSRLNDIQFVGADLNNTTFIEVELRGVNLSGANLEGVTFLRVIGDGTNFETANLSKSVFAQDCSFKEASFKYANLSQANLRGTRLVQSDFSGASLIGADLSECDLFKANISGVFATGALFVKARLTKAEVCNSNLMNANLQKADICGADLRNSCFFQADLARVFTDKHALYDNANFKKARILPKRSIE